MASAKLPPRQKMIGMMYLVLTALLALNVSKEILNSFVVVNTGLETTVKGFTHNTAQLYAEFDRLKLYDPIRVAPNYAKAMQAKAMTAELTSYILSIKHRLIRETEGYKHKEEDTVFLGNVDGKDNINTPTEIMIGSSEDGSTGVARTLKDKLNVYREKMMALLDDEDRKNVHLSIDTKNPPRTDDDSSINWEMNNFYHTPLAAAATILTKFETDTKDAESEVVEHLLAKSSGETLPFDTVAAKVVSESNYVLLGEQYKADVFIAAFNKTLKTDVISGDYNLQTKTFQGTVDSVPVNKGMGKFVAAATSEGIKKMRGIIRMRTPKGKIFEYPYESEYIVAKPSLTVSAEKMNILYAGLVNPISVSVPGVPSDKLSISIENGRLIPHGGGKFDLVEPKAGVVKVHVMALLENGERRSMGDMEFRVKNLPRPLAKIGALTAGGKMKKEMLAASSALVCFYDKFDFQATPHVISCDYVCVNNGLEDRTPLPQGILSDKCIQKIKRAKRGEQVTFENIKAIGPDGQSATLDPITIRIE